VVDVHCALIVSRRALLVFLTGISLYSPDRALTKGRVTVRDEVAAEDAARNQRDHLVMLQLHVSVRRDRHFNWCCRCDRR